ncbi:MAG: 30S ribosomal protein S6 [Bacteroidetes bacterium]|nr:30S ribosomal protein S6 [Bacteroidota bacterium]
MPNQYETVFIVTPILTDDKLKETIKKYVDILKNDKAEIVDEIDWGLRKTAYPIQKKNNGYYYIIEYKAEPEVIANFETLLNRDEDILRFLTFKLDKYAIKYYVKRRQERKTEKKDTEEKKDVEEKKEAEPVKSE